MKIIVLVFTILFHAAIFANAEKKGAPQEITLPVQDSIPFVVLYFEVSAGKEVKIVFKNSGKLPKIAMGHNLVLLKKGVSAIAFGQKALGAGANAVNPLPDSIKEDVIASTKLLGPGEEEVISFTAPKEKGAYEYVCTFPGHFAMMRGTMTVK